ncbi:Protein of unknown function [Natronoarchaeum philippinense]|uniref:DUF3006 domain-containing protein n=1 Tax=Natronoarchaeum philippinense TaxID=558529 RepID=A0A285P0I7_NATPI|nr:DUF3006 domain-containing protein [Natronoarchaeum philippinense]SNZ15254.1 Protein of unknown function [Natronoarchaeum philippinense]
MDSRQLTGVIDRFEGDLAVVLLEADGDVVDETTVERDELPEDAAHANAVLSVTLAEDTVLDVTYDDEETTQREQDARERFDRLAERPPSDENDS